MYMYGTDNIFLKLLALLKTIVKVIIMTVEITELMKYHLTSISVIL